MVKNIIKRIIVGFGIALLLMLCKDYILLDVHAQSVNVNPDTLCAINNNGDSCNMSNVNTYTIYERPMYGNAFGSNTYRGRIVWHFTGNNLSDKTYDLTFLVYIAGGTQYDYPNRGYIQNSDNNLYSCHIDTTKLNQNDAQTTSMTGTATVSCNNVYMSGNWGFFYLVDINTISNGVVAISPITFTESVSAKQTKELEEINDNITSEETPSDNDIGSIFDSSEDTSNTPVSSLITMPITLLQKFNDGFSASCGSYDLGSLYGHHIILPCIDLQGLLGSELWSLIDMLFSLFLVYNIGLMCIDIYESITSLDDGFRSLYTPKHGPTAYQPKHGGDS